MGTKALNEQCVAARAKKKEEQDKKGTALITYVGASMTLITAADATGMSEMVIESDEQVAFAMLLRPQWA